MVSKDITSNIDDVSVLCKESTKYKSGNIHSGTWAKFYRNVCFDTSVVLCILNIYCALSEKIGRIANVVAKVSFGNRRWNKKPIASSATYIKNKKSYQLDLQLHIEFIAFSFFLLHTLFSVGCFADSAANADLVSKSNRLQIKSQTWILFTISLTSVSYCTQCFKKKYIKLYQSSWCFNPEKYAHQY